MNKKYHFFLATVNDWVADECLVAAIDKLREETGDKRMQKRRTVNIYKVLLPVSAKYEINYFQPVLDKKLVQLVDTSYVLEKFTGGE
jgi:hypothetical protein